MQAPPVVDVCDCILQGLLNNAIKSGRGSEISSSPNASFARAARKGSGMIEHGIAKDKPSKDIYK